MANVYLQYSEMITDLTPAETEWWEKELERIEKKSLEENYCPGQFEIERGENWDAIWIYGEDFGDPHTAAEIVQRFLKECRPDGCFSLTWATTCSKMRLSEFSGGGVFVTADDIKWVNAYTFVEDAEIEWRENKNKS